MLFRPKKTISVTLKLYSGIDKDAGIKGYDPYKGLILQVKDKTRLKKVLTSTGVRNLSSNAYFIDGRRVSLWTRLSDGNEIACMKPSAGG